LFLSRSYILSPAAFGANTHMPVKPSNEPPVTAQEIDVLIRQGVQDNITPGRRQRQGALTSHNGLVICSLKAEMG